MNQTRIDKIEQLSDEIIVLIEDIKFIKSPILREFARKEVNKLQKKIDNLTHFQVT